MTLKHVHLNQFRNFGEGAFDINQFLTVIIGENARGKTNLLESIFFSINGVGFRESREEELIYWEKDTASVECVFEDVIFTIFLSKKDQFVEKKFTVNRAKKTHKQYQEYQSKAVLFAPEHIDIVNGSPDRRREYINKVISLYDYEYKRKLTNYEHALRKRNKVLEFHKDQATLVEELAFWNTYLEEQATYITQKRQEYVEYLNAHKEVQNRIFEMEYGKNELTAELLEKNLPVEKKWRKTLIGPQKDEFIIYQIENGVRENIHLFGSRSEQRLGVFWLKLNEIHFFETFFKQKPVLLLDDVFSELDTKNKKVILDLVKEYQTVITTTEDELLNLPEVEKTVIRI
jgi:DNA replication and repair protein RecF